MGQYKWSLKKFNMSDKLLFGTLSKINVHLKKALPKLLL